MRTSLRTGGTYFCTYSLSFLGRVRLLSKQPGQFTTALTGVSRYATPGSQLQVVCPPTAGLRGTDPPTPQFRRNTELESTSPTRLRWAARPKPNNGSDLIAPDLTSVTQELLFYYNNYYNIIIIYDQGASRATKGISTSSQGQFNCHPTLYKLILLKWDEPIPSG